MQFLEGVKFEPVQLSFSPDGTVLAATGSGYRLLLWTFPEGKLSRQVSGNSPDHDSVVISPESRACAVILPTERSPAQIHRTTLPSVRAKKSPSTPRQSNAVLSARCARFSSDGSRLEIVAHDAIYSSPSANQLVHFRWDLESNRLLEHSRNEIRRGARLGFVWTLDPSITWVGMMGIEKVGFWNLEERQFGFEVAIPSEAWPEGLSFSRDSRRFACSTTKVVHVIDVANRKRLLSFENPTNKHIQSLALSPDGQTLATVSYDGLVRFCETDTGRELKTYDWGMGPLKAVAVAPDGMRAAAANKKGQIVVWDLD